MRCVCVCLGAIQVRCVGEGCASEVYVCVGGGGGG